MERVRRRGWRYFATRLNGDGTETMIDPDLPLSNVTIEDALSGDPSISADIEPSYSRLLAADGNPVLLEWSTAIYAEQDGDIRGGWILQSTQAQGPTLSLEAYGWTSYLRDMPYTGSGYKGVKVDPLDVVRLIWAHVQSQPGGNIGMTLAPTTTGGKVVIGSTLAANQYDPAGGGIDGLALESQAFKLNIYSNHDLAGDIDTLAEATPFDYRERHFWKPDGTIGHHLEFGYPGLGERRPDLRFVLGVNVFDSPEVSRDGESYASGTLVLGAGDGAQAKRSLVEPPVRPAGRLRRIAVVVDDRLRSIPACSRRAEIENQWRRTLDDISTLTVQDHPNARLGEAKVGDVIRVQGRDDWTTYDLEVKITAISYSPSDGSFAQYSIQRTDRISS